jgi:hypothetical protein
MKKKRKKSAWTDEGRKVVVVIQAKAIGKITIDMKNDKGTSERAGGTT